MNGFNMMAQQQRAQAYRYAQQHGGLPTYGGLSPSLKATVRALWLVTLFVIALIVGLYLGHTV